MHDDREDYVVCIKRREPGAESGWRWVPVWEGEVPGHAEALDRVISDSGLMTISTMPRSILTINCMSKNVREWKVAARVEAIA